MLLKPKVSICIPAYNQTAYLKTLLESIARQTFTDYEIIISDDSSTKDVERLLSNFPFGDNLKYHRNNPSLGSPANWNAAIDKATGSYIKIMHHDDAFAGSTALDEMVAYMETNNRDYVFSDSSIENVKDTGQNRIHKIRKFEKLKRKPYLLFFGNSIGGPSALLIKKESLGELKYDAAYIWLVDIEYYTRLFTKSSNGANISKPLVITHDAAEHRLTSTILKDFELQVKEQIMLYNNLSPTAPPITRFFMKVYMTRLLCRSGTKNAALIHSLSGHSRLVRIYFSFIKFKPLYFAYKIFITLADITRKILFR